MNLSDLAKPPAAIVAMMASQASGVLALGTAVSFLYMRAGSDALPVTGSVDAWPVSGGLSLTDLRVRVDAGAFAGLASPGAPDCFYNVGTHVYYDILLASADSTGGVLTFCLRARGVNRIVPRRHVLSRTCDSAWGTVQVTVSDLPFRWALFYGVSGLSDAGQSLANSGSVFLGEAETEMGGIYYFDEITPAAPVRVESVSGFNLNLRHFWVRIPTVGDRVFVVYQ